MATLNSNIPALRFPEFQPAWITTTCGDITTKVSRKNKNSVQYPIYSINNVSGFVPQEEQFDGMDSNARGYDISMYKIIAANTFAYNPARINVGSIGYSGALNDIIISSLYVCFKTTEEANDEFLLHHFKSARFLKAVLRSVEGGVRDYLFYENFSQIKINLPTLPEQQKIAAFLTAIDQKLQALKKKHALLQQYKKGIMQQLFSQQLRFKDDNGNEFPDWEEKYLSDVTERVTTKNKVNCDNVLTISAQHGLISQLEFFNKSVAAKDITGYYLLSKGDFAYNKSYSNGYPMGAVKRLTRYELGVVSTLYICFRNKPEFDSRYAQYYFDAGCLNKGIESVAQEGARNHGLLNISVGDFFGISILLPSPAEQTKISNFLAAMDDKINLAHTQVQQVEQYKKGLLQAMFV
jgi:type I restriction enzyme, S subunit